MSAVGGKAVVIQGWPGGPLIAKRRPWQPLGEVRLDGEKNDRKAFQARADYQNDAIGWRQGDTVPLAVGREYNSHEVGYHPGNVGEGKLDVDRR